MLGCDAPDREEPAADPAPPEAELELPAPLPPSRDELVTNGLMTVAGSRAEFAVSLGSPDSVWAEVAANRHVPNVQDTLYTLFYPGLIAHLHRPGGGGELLAGVEVFDNRYLRYPAIGIGATPAGVAEALGPPDEVTDDSVHVYTCSGCTEVEEPVRFYFNAGRVYRIAFAYYVD